MYIKIDCACIGVIFDSTLVLLIILLTLDGVGLSNLMNVKFDINKLLNKAFKPKVLFFVTKNVLIFTFALKPFQSLFFKFLTKKELNLKLIENNILELNEYLLEFINLYKIETSPFCLNVVEINCILF